MIEIFALGNFDPWTDFVLVLFQVPNCGRQSRMLESARAEISNRERGGSPNEGVHCK